MTRPARSSVHAHALAYTNLQLDEVHVVVDALRDQVLHLQSRVHLHEVERTRRLRRVAQKLHRSRALVSARLRESGRPRVQLLALLVREVELQSSRTAALTQGASSMIFW